MASQILKFLPKRWLLVLVILAFPPVAKAENDLLLTVVKQSKIDFEAHGWFAARMVFFQLSNKSEKHIYVLCRKVKSAFFVGGLLTHYDIEPGWVKRGRKNDFLGDEAGNLMVDAENKRFVYDAENH